MTAPSPVCQVTASLRPRNVAALALVIERLPVAADEFRFQAKSALGRQHRIRVKFAEQEIQPGQISHAGALASSSPPARRGAPACG